MLGISAVRYVTIQALAALILLIATLWTFERTRGIATAMADVPVGITMWNLVRSRSLL